MRAMGEAADVRCLTSQASAVSPFASTSTFTRIASGCVVASSTNMGAIIRHGGHHVAVKSTTTSLFSALAVSRSASNSALSSTILTMMTMRAGGEVARLRGCGEVRGARCEVAARGAGRREARLCAVASAKRRSSSSVEMRSVKLVPF